MRGPARAALRGTGLCLLGLLAGCASGTIGARPGPNEEGVWSIRCGTLYGPNRFRLSQAWAAALKNVRGLKPELVQVLNLEDESVVYYGYYRRSYDPRGESATFKPDPQPDLKLIRQLSLIADGRPVWPFIYATMEELPTARSQRPEWDLENAGGYWTLHVAVFYNEGPITNRRYLAEEYCRELREQGVEAYYHHGPVRSSVYVGLFPRSAVQTIKKTDPLTGAITFVNQIVDERLLDLQRRFPRSYQNARIVNEIARDPDTGQIIARRPIQSFIVMTPRAQAAERAGSGE